jgi:hypothetical protein
VAEDLGGGRVLLFGRKEVEQVRAASSSLLGRGI